MSATGPNNIDLDMQIRLAADKVLRAITLRRQAKVVVLASAALSIAAAVRPDLLPPDLLALKNLLNVSAISSLLKDVAQDDTLSDEQLAARLEALLPDARLDQLVTGQADLLRALTRQHSWQQQMLRLQADDAEAGARLLAAFANVTGDLAAIRDGLAAVATQAQVNDLLRLITDEVLPRLSDAARQQYNLSGDFRGAMVNINSTVTIAWPVGVAYVPPAPPALGELSRPGPLPPGAFIPFDRNPFFTGRGDDLLALAALLLSPSELVTPHSSLVTISAGIGGVGKTQLAVEFAYRYGRFFHGVHWVSAENPDAIDAAIAECGRRMGLHPTFGHLPLPDQVALTERAWAGPEARLVIFDNCEEPRALARRPKGGGARLLVTSRRERWDGELGGAVRPVRPLPNDDSVRLLRRHLTEGEGRPPRGDIGDDDLRPIAAELGELPLALRLAGAYLRLYKRETAADYLAALRRPDVLAHPSLRQDGQSTGGHVPDVGRTFAVSFDKLQPDNPTDADALSLLACAACFAPGEPLPEALLLAAGEEAAGRGQPPAARALDDGLERLLELGLLEGAGADAVRLHRLIARFVAGESARQDAREEAGGMAAARAAVEGAVNDLAQQQNKAGDPRSGRTWEVHLRYVTDVAFGRDNNRAADLCNEMGYYLQMGGDLAGARPYYERALAIRERVLGPDHPDTAGSLNNLGVLCYHEGNFATAAGHMRRALAIRERVLGSDHPNTRSSRDNLAAIEARLR